jgi:hypothetical protein
LGYRNPPNEWGFAIHLFMLDCLVRPRALHPVHLLLAAALLGIAACSLTERPSPAGSGPSDVATVGPEAFATVDPGSLPGGAQPLEDEDIGIVDSQPPTADGNVALSSIACRGDLLSIETTAGTILAKVPRVGELSCEQTAGQWRLMAAQTQRVGLRHRGTESGETLQFVSVGGGGATIRVVGAWRVRG